MKILISNALIDSYFSQHEFVSVNNVLREYDHMEEEVKNLKSSTVHQGLYFI